MARSVRTPSIEYALRAVRRLKALLRRPPVAELVLAACLVLVCAIWTGAGETNQSLHMLLASTATSIVLLLCFITRTRRRRRYHAANAAILTGEIRRRSKLYRAVVDTAADAIILADQRGTVLSFNRAAEQIFGYEAAEVMGRSARMLAPEDQWQTHANYISRYLDSKTPHVIGTGRVVEGLRKDGTQFWASGVVQPILDNSANVLGAAVVLRDATKQREDAELLRVAKEHAEAAAQVESKLRAELEETNQELTTANQGLQQFTSIAAHDLRAPLRRIGAFIDALREDFSGQLDTEGQEIMTRIGRGASRMEMMLDSLLDYSRFNAKAIGGKTAELSHVIRGVMETFDFQTLTPDITINADNTPHIKGDPLLLAHIFQNLISNSIKFRRGDKVAITIDAKMAGDVVQVTVTDDGIGIEPHYADQVFDMFARLHNEDEYEGTGIGLTVCRKIINDHGGRIWVDKDYSGGTRIHMTLLPVSNETETTPDLVMMLYHSMQRRTRNAQLSIDADAIPAHLQSRGGMRSSHHAKFDRRSK